MPYSSLLEFVAERYHAEQDFLRKLNPGMDLEKLQPGDTVNVPNVQPFEIEKLSKNFIPANPAFATRQIYIDTRENFLEVREGDRLVAEFRSLQDRNAARAEGRLENPRGGDPALVPAR